MFLLNKNLCLASPFSTLFTKNLSNFIFNAILMFNSKYLNSLFIYRELLGNMLCPWKQKFWWKKRLQCFLEHCKMRRLKSRMDVYMENLKTVSNKEVYDLDEQDVLKFQIYKNVNNSGRGT